MNQPPARQSSPLNDADRALIARDTDLPGLGLLLDEEVLLDEVGRQMPAADVACIRIDYLRYKPGTSCMAGLRVIDTLGRTQHAFARALTASNPDWDQHAARLQKRAALDGRFSAHVLPRTRLLLASAVHDRRITALGTLLNTPGTLDGSHPLPDDLGIEQHLYEREIQAHVLRYKPERRMVLQLRQGSRPVGVLRACTEREFPATEAGARLARAFQGTAPLAVGATRHFLVMPWQRGQSLDMLGNDTARAVQELSAHGEVQPADMPQLDLGLFADIGLRLGELHEARIAHPVHRTVADDIDALTRAAGSIARLLPALGGRAHSLADRTAQALQQASTGWQPCITHGDLSLEQMVRDPLGQLQFIDWDNAALGDPMADAGSLLARLATQYLGRSRTAPTPETLADLLDTVHDALARGIDASSALPATLSARAPHTRRRAGWHTVAGLLRLAPEGFRRRRPSWPEQMEQIVALAEYLAAQLQPAPLHAATAPAGTTEPPSTSLPSTTTGAVAAETTGRETSSMRPAPAHPAAAEAGHTPVTAGAPGTGNTPSSWPQTDRTLMQPLLLDALHLPAGDWQLEPVRVLRHKAGRRALLDYTLIHRVPAETTRTSTAGTSTAGIPAPDTPATPATAGCATPGAAPAATATTRIELLGKLRFKGADRHGFAVQKALYEHGFDLPWVALPEALAILPEQRLWLQRRVPGTMASHLIRPGSDPGLSFRIGQALAALHRAGGQLQEAARNGQSPGAASPAIDPTRRWTLEDELDMLHNRLEKAAEARPAWAERIRALIPATRRLARRLPTTAPTGIHRDCYADQILVDGERLTWLDLDLFCLGDPALDVGNFVAHLMEDALRHHGSLHALQAHQQALTDGFRQDAPHVDMTAIEGWTLLSLARHIQLSTQFDDRHTTTLPLLEYCEHQLGI